MLVLCHFRCATVPLPARSNATHDVSEPRNILNARTTRSASHGHVPKLQRRATIRSVAHELSVLGYV